jgi:CBS domain-containing protein
MRPSSAVPAAADRARPTDPVRLIMATPVASVDVGASLVEVATELAADEIGAVIVTGAGAPGVLTERDIVTVLGTGGDPEQAQAGDVATRELIWVSPDDPVTAAAEAMLEAGMRHVVVGDGQHVAGMLSVRDVLAVVLA